MALDMPQRRFRPQASDALQMPTTGGDAIPPRIDRRGEYCGPRGQGTQEVPMGTSAAAMRMPLGEINPREMTSGRIPCVDRLAA